MPLNGGIHVWKPSSNYPKECHPSVACVYMHVHMCVFFRSLFSLLFSAGLFSTMNFYFLSTPWLIGFKKATCASRCLWTCTSDVWRFISSPASWLIINSSSEFWHVQINNHSVKMSMTTFVPTQCSKRRRMWYSWTHGIYNLMREAKMYAFVYIYIFPSVSHSLSTYYSLV